MSLSETRLAEIRGVLGAPNIELRGDPYEAILRTAGMADDLLSEVDRFRAGIEALLNDPSHHETYEGGAHACIDADDLNALLNPPTEEYEPCCRYCGEPGSDHPYPCC